MELSIIIVNWNSTDCLMQCLGSIYGHSSGFDFEIIVVDNASPENVSALVNDRFPELLFIRSPATIGFANANNLGFGYAHGNWILFLNPDTEVVGNAIATMLGHAIALDRVGAVGCRLLNSDLTVQTSSILRFPTILNQVVESEALRQLAQKPLFVDSPAPHEVEGISGTCMLVKREAFLAAGGFNTDYFQHAGDVHLCYRIRKEGYRIYYTGDASVIHHGGRSAGSDADREALPVLEREATYKLLRSERGPLYAACFKSAIGLAAAIRLVLLALASPLALCTGRGRRIGTSFGKWLRLLFWSCGIRGASSPHHPSGGTV